jgi:hypothetical protein
MPNHCAGGCGRCVSEKGSFCKPCAENLGVACDTRGKTKKINDKSNKQRKASGQLQVDNAKINNKHNPINSAKRKAELEEKVAEISKRKLEDPSTDECVHKVTGLIETDTHSLEFADQLTRASRNGRHQLSRCEYASRCHAVRLQRRRTPHEDRVYADCEEEDYRK